MLRYEYYILFNADNKLHELIVTLRHKLNSATKINETREDIQHLCKVDNVILVNFKLLRVDFSLRRLFNE